MGKSSKKSGKKKAPPPIEEAPDLADVLIRPNIGNYLTIAAAVTFQFVLILLPLVGPAGAVAPHATKNFVAFLAVLLLALALSGLAVYSKLKRRQIDGSPLPYWSFALTGVCLFFLFALFAGLLRI